MDLLIALNAMIVIGREGESLWIHVISIAILIATVAFSVVDLIRFFKENKHSNDSKRSGDSDDFHHSNGYDVKSFEEFVRLYKKNLKYYNAVFNDREKKMLAVTIMYVILSGFCIILPSFIHNRYYDVWKVFFISAVVEFIKLLTYQRIPSIKASFQAKMERKRSEKTDFLMSSLESLGIRTDDREEMSDLISVCKERMEDADLYKVERKYAAFFLTALMIPMLLATFKALCDTDKIKNSISEILKLALLSLLFVFVVATFFYAIFVQVIEPFINKEQKMYKSLIIDLEDIYLCKREQMGWISISGK